MKLDEIAPIPAIKPIGAGGNPPPTTAANTASGASSIGNTAPNVTPGGGTVSSQSPISPATPISQSGVDALAQVIKNAGLSPQQIAQLMSKAK